MDGGNVQIHPGGQSFDSLMKMGGTRRREGQILEGSFFISYATSVGLLKNAELTNKRSIFFGEGRAKRERPRKQIAKSDLVRLRKKTLPLES